MPINLRTKASMMMMNLKQNCRISSYSCENDHLYGKLFATIMISMGFTTGNIVSYACPV